MLITTKEAAERTDLSDSQIRRLIRLGLLKAKKFGHTYMIESLDLRHIKRRRRHKNGIDK